MSNIHDVFKDDDVRGTIIGGDYVSGRLFYDGRLQGNREFADTEDDLKFVLLERMAEIKNECGDVLRYIYPDAKWELRID